MCHRIFFEVIPLYFTSYFSVFSSHFLHTFYNPVNILLRFHLWFVNLYFLAKFTITMRTRSSVSLFATPPSKCADQLSRRPLSPPSTRGCSRGRSSATIDIPGESAAPVGRDQAPVRSRSCLRSRSSISVDLRRESAAPARGVPTRPSRTCVKHRQSEESVVPPTKCRLQSGAQGCKHGRSSVVTDTQEFAVPSSGQIPPRRMPSCKRGRKRKFYW